MVTTTQAPHNSDTVAPSGNTRGGRSAADLEKALLSIRQARDTLIARNLDLSSKLAVADDRVSELEYDREAAEQDRDASLKLVQELSQQSDELRERVLALTDESSRLQSTQCEAASARATESADGMPVGEDVAAEIQELRSRLAEFQTMETLTKSQQAKHAATLGNQLTAAQRARDIAVGAVTNAQRQIGRLAEECKELRSKLTADNETSKARILQLEMQIQAREPESAEPENDPTSETSFIDPLASVVSDDVGREAELIRACTSSLVSDHRNPDILAELDERYHGFAASAGGLGYAGIARFSSACGELTRWLCKTPRKMEETLQSLIDAAALLVEISAEGRPEEIDDLAGALVFSVDDDGDNCECIAMSLEKSALKTRYALKSGIALAELRSLSCALIILDVDLPDMNGFELFDCIREMPHHRETPIIFLSGLMSTRDRMASLPGGQQAFVAKPYNLNELGVIVLGMILKARLAKNAKPAIVTIV